MMIELALANILANVVTNFGNTELNYISDFRGPGLLIISITHSIEIVLPHLSTSQSKPVCCWNCHPETFLFGSMSTQDFAKGKRLSFFPKPAQSLRRGVLFMPKLE